LKARPIRPALRVAAVILVLVPVFAGASQPVELVRTVGILSRPGASGAFETGLGALGWVEGKNVRFERRESTDPQQLAKLAADLTRLQVDIIFAGSAASTRAAMQATKTIPIVTVSADPVATGFVASLARPGGNVTGVAILNTELSGKRLEILTQALPSARRVAFLANPTNPSATVMRQETEIQARASGVQILHFEATAPARIASTMDAIAKVHPDALLVASDPLFFVAQQQMLAATMRHGLPAMFEFRGFVDAGGLLAYGADLGELYRRAATYADRILKGTKPGDLPVEQATKIELSINLKTAKTLGITIPSPVLLRADHVVQ
jgi:putative tryptophan/tyrosine transport system substrate-binding protein